MSMEMGGDPKLMEQFASDNRDKMQTILEAAKQHGLIAHRFYGSDDGSRILILDEWPDRESFESFFSAQAPEIVPMMQQVLGAGAEPHPSFWHELTTHDEYGWDS
jgi:hypothetical protein